MMLKFPCGVCGKSVKKNALCCDLCNQWIHIKCHNIDKKTYNILSNSYEEWYCKTCLNQHLPFSSVSDNKFLQDNKLRENPIEYHIQEEIDKMHKALGDYEETPSKYYYSLSEFNNIPLSGNYSGVFHLNIESLSAHISELQEFLNISNAKFDTVCITESRIKKDKVSLSNLTIPGYAIESQPTESTKGGVLLYISDDLRYKCRSDLTVYKPKDLESIFIEVLKSNGKNLIIGGIYKHPNLYTEEFIESYLLKLLDTITKENKDIILMSDFNINLLNHDTNEAISHFIDTMYQNSIQPHILAPTRVIANSKTLIDNIFTNFINTDSKAGNLTLSTSDYLPQFLFLQENKKTKPNRNSKISSRDFSKFDKVQFLKELKAINWEELLEHDQAIIIIIIILYLFSVRRYINKR